MHRGILIVDFGSQFTQLIARRLRAACVFCQIFPAHKAHKELEKGWVQGVILSGSPHSVHFKDSPTLAPSFFKGDVPVLGICYGQQLLVHEMGGVVEGDKDAASEFGHAHLKIAKDSPLFDGIASQGERVDVWMSHKDHVSVLPQGFEIVASSDGAPFAAIAHPHRHIYGVQFHPEVVHTQNGATLLENFALKIAHCAPLWRSETLENEALDEIRTRVGQGHVLCAVSGGVDSSVLATLLAKALGDRVTCVFVQTGLLRDKEEEEVVSFLKSVVPLRVVSASDVFLNALKGVSDPEEKRKRIGETFIRLFEKEARSLSPKPTFLAQGTLYPDVIESRSASGSQSALIKSHHNVGGLPDVMDFELLEPFKFLFKDEVRALGRRLNMAPYLVNRHPFPGPGLAVRILGEVTHERVALLQKADAIYIEELRREDLYDKTWQAFAILLPVKSVGVMGDARTYESVCALRAVHAEDAMSAQAYPLPMSFLTRVATRIVNEVRGINRVVYDITSKPPGTIEWE